MTLIGSEVIFFTSALSASSERLRSRTCVAPISRSHAALRGDAVVMMGLNPDTLSSWMAVRWCVSSLLSSGVYDGKLTVLADRAGTAEHYDRLAVVLAPSACLPGRSEPGSTVHGTLRVVERKGGGREG